MDSLFKIELRLESEVNRWLVKSMPALLALITLIFHLFNEAEILLRYFWSFENSACACLCL